ncbi:MAG: GPW/gp25 family protein [Rikenellaceae bacterium]|nr:GPW/gp25 family protein [Rikenellaceae bacterium]
MNEGNYKLPLDISRFFLDGKGRLDQCSEVESIDQFLGLLLTTHPGEHGFDQRFGTKIWELDFENIVSLPAWKERFRNYILDSVRENEKRLKDIDVSLEVREVVREEMALDCVTVRKQVDIKIRGIIASSGRPAAFRHVVYLGPLSRN